MASDATGIRGAASAAALIAAGFVANLTYCGQAWAYTEKTLYKFCSNASCTDGKDPGGLVMDQSGNLIGVTSFGGRKGDFSNGVVFEFVPGTGQYRVLYSFCTQPARSCPDGAVPGTVNLVIDTQGNLYGTTAEGGSTDGGVVFELVRNGSKWKEKTLYSFCSRKNCADGDGPQFGLTYAGAGSGPYDGTSPLFGATVSGGTGSYGTVFSLKPKIGTQKWSELVLYDFCSQANCSDGSRAVTPLYIDGRGNIYGTTEAGGNQGGGVVFELSPNGSGYTETTAYSFCSLANCADGATPAGGVVMDASGNLYGTTAVGGNQANGQGVGVVFELSPGGTQWNYTDLADFGGKDGAGPIGPLLLDSSGNLFGTTVSGG
jgi:uncharacterized repeat protein (TIGR03803 family)